MSILSMIQKGKISKPPITMIYGEPGIGKSSYGAKARNPIFIQAEDGLNEIDCAKFPLVETLKDAFDQITALLNEPHDYQTLVIDSMSSFEKLVWNEVCRKYGVGSIEKADGGFQRGYKEAFDIWVEIMKTIRSLRDARNMEIILTAHATINKIPDPTSTEYTAWGPDLHKLAAAHIRKEVDNIFFATKEIRIEKEEAGFNKKRAIAHQTGDDRIMICNGKPNICAKNRYGLPDKLPLDWNAFIAAVQAANTSPAPSAMNQITNN